jgi:hypothetical protein
MATKLTKYSYYANIQLASGKTRHLFTNDTVARTKVLIKAGHDMAGVNWTKLDPAMTKAEYLSGEPVKPQVETAVADQSQEVA